VGKGVHVYECVTWGIHCCLIVEQVLLFFIDSWMHWENPMLVYFFTSNNTGLLLHRQYVLFPRKSILPSLQKIGSKHSMHLDGI
jgi:hypothetical protein